MGYEEQEEQEENDDERRNTATMPNSLLTCYSPTEQTSPSASQATASSPASRSPSSASGTANHFGKSLYLLPSGFWKTPSSSPNIPRKNDNSVRARTRQANDMTLVLADAQYALAQIRPQEPLHGRTAVCRCLHAAAQGGREGRGADAWWCCSCCCRWEGGEE